MQFSHKFSIFLLTAAVVMLSGCSHFHWQNESGTGPLGAAIDFYRGPMDHLNAVRAGACPMYPGCSEYARRAIDKHGPVLGWIMACDRLLRCGRDELKKSPQIRLDGNPKCYDTLAKNDWWWHSPDFKDDPASSRNWQISID
ncbi:MAG: membrane protein insertion efficiency factor YidD [Desulfobacterales bacterium]